jgi:succinyl-diaminopimelate desuccinylase
VTDVAERLATRTEELLRIPSESRCEGHVLAWIRDHVPPGFAVVEDEDAVLLAMPEPRTDAPLIVLAGHVDTVPAAGSEPVRREDDVLRGRGAADMKGGVAVMLEVAAGSGGGRDLDLGLVFFGREELPFGESALLPLLQRRSELRGAALAILLEPTANRLELGCLGNLNATLTAEGEAAHTARPWLGRNAIHTALRALAPVVAARVLDVEVDGLTFRESSSVTGIEGGIAGNVVPDRAVARLNVRYAPTRTPEEAERSLRALIASADVGIEVLANAPPGPVPVGNPLVDRLRAAGDLTVGPKQAWTPVAEFGLIGVDAVNLGPGDPQYAHRDDERVEIAALVRSYDVLRAFLDGRGTEG